MQITKPIYVNHHARAEANREKCLANIFSSVVFERSDNSPKTYQRTNKLLSKDVLRLYQYNWEQLSSLGHYSFPCHGLPSGRATATVTANWGNQAMC